MARVDSSDSGSTCDWISSFQTSLGWWGIVGRAERLHAVFVGHLSPVTLMKATHEWYGASSPVGALNERDWYPALRKRLQAYSEGERVDFDDIKLALPQCTPFQHRILAATKRIRFGETTTYGELARQVGHPRAARAVGTVMSTNRFPIVIPCHRVLAAGGKLGGYTSPSGPDFKLRLLDLER